MPGKNRSVAAFESRRGAGRCSSGSTPTFRSPSEPLIDPERAAQGKPAARHRSVSADEERQRPEQPRRDARERAPLEDRMPRVPQPPVLERPKAAVHGLLMVERRGRFRSRPPRRAPCAARGWRRRRRWSSPWIPPPTTSRSKVVAASVSRSRGRMTHYIVVGLEALPSSMNLIKAHAFGNDFLLVHARDVDGVVDRPVARARGLRSSPWHRRGRSDDL